MKVWNVSLYMQWIQIMRTLFFNQIFEDKQTFLTVLLFLRRVCRYKNVTIHFMLFTLCTSHHLHNISINIKYLRHYSEPLGLNRSLDYTHSIGSPCAVSILKPQSAFLNEKWHIHTGSLWSVTFHCATVM